MRECRGAIATKVPPVSASPRLLAAVVADLAALRDVSDAQTVPLNHDAAVRLLIEAAEATAEAIDTLAETVAAAIAAPQAPAA
jgi:hypothetical protein